MNWARRRLGVTHSVSFCYCTNSSVAAVHHMRPWSPQVRCYNRWIPYGISGITLWFWSESGQNPRFSAPNRDGIVRFSPGSRSNPLESHVGIYGNPWILRLNPPRIRLWFRLESDLNPRFSAFESVLNPRIPAWISIESIGITFHRQMSLESVDSSHCTFSLTEFPSLESRFSFRIRRFQSDSGLQILLKTRMESVGILQESHWNLIHFH